jgi:hypothetical protein
VNNYLEFVHDGDLYQVSIAQGKAVQIVRFPPNQIGTEIDFDDLDFLTQAKIQHMIFEASDDGANPRTSKKHLLNGNGKSKPNT